MSVYAAEVRFELPDDFDGDTQDAMDAMAEYILNGLDEPTDVEVEDAPEAIQLNEEMDNAYLERSPEQRLVWSDGVFDWEDGNVTTISEGNDES